MWKEPELRLLQRRLRSCFLPQKLFMSPHSTCSFSSNCIRMTHWFKQPGTLCPFELPYKEPTAGPPQTLLVKFDHILWKQCFLVFPLISIRLLCLSSLWFMAICILLDARVELLTAAGLRMNSTCCLMCLNVSSFLLLIHQDDWPGQYTQLTPRNTWHCVL